MVLIAPRKREIIYQEIEKGPTRLIGRVVGNQARSTHNSGFYKNHNTPKSYNYQVLRW